MPANLRLISKYYNQGSSFAVLDVGCGKQGAQIIKSFFPSCLYYGIDKEMPDDTGNLFKKYFQIDLTLLNFDVIPDDHFDLMIMSHVIEHLINGDEVIRRLIPKLKSKGLIYIEFPSLRSTKLPSKKGTLNFFDDPTHCRLYTLDEIYDLLREKNFKILKGGTRRDIINVLLTPYNMMKSKTKKGFVAGSVFWDLLGFSQFVLAVKC